MGTMLHEMGHAVYDKSIDPAALPATEASHTLTTEGMAMLFGRMSKNALWMQQMAGLPEARRVEVEGELRRMLTFEQLTFAGPSHAALSALYSDPNRISTRCGGSRRALPAAASPGRPPGSRLRVQVPRRHGAGVLPQLSARELMASQAHAYPVSDAARQRP
jgi:hypothetical protein